MKTDVDEVKSPVFKHPSWIYIRLSGVSNTIPHLGGLA
jgi:hypothetical protein